jgi:peptide/nickel transport system substrate-binding protein
MGKRAWIILAAVLTVVLMVASCGTSTTSTGPASSTSPATIVPPTTSVKPETEKPKYGGIYNSVTPGDTFAWDPTQQHDLMGFQISIQNEPLMMGDWTKGPAGTGETDWQGAHLGQTKLLTGQLAESYEMPDTKTLIFHIRKGIKWWSKAPANGREFTAQDAAWNIQKQWDNPMGNMNAFFGKAQAPTSVEATDKYTVVCKYPGDIGMHVLEDGNRIYCMLPELYPKQNDWHNSLGTGAFMIKDYIPAVSFTFEKNLNYWQTNPIGPGKGDQLPYLDGIKILIISDSSTQMAAFRTGKADTYGGLDGDDFKELQTSMPWEFEYKYAYGMSYFPQTRMDKELPVNDIRVRQAMNLAVDKQAVLDGYYGGEGELMAYPYTKAKGLRPYYTPLEELPEDCQELIKGGNVEKAKQLLTDAGYPNGFKLKSTTSAGDVDFASLLKEQLKQVNIDLQIDVMEGGKWYQMMRGRTWEEMLMVWPKQSFMPHYLFEYRAEANDSCVFKSFPETDAVLAEINTWLGIDDSKWSKALKDVTPWMIRTSIGIFMPAPYRYQVWQPWLKNYYAATNLGSMLPYHNCYFNWIDQDLKEQMVGRR